MSVELQPNNVLAFQRPLTQMVKRTLSITNPQSSPVAFKVKTTAPKQYCVRPNAGRIEPGEKVEVSVLLQAMKDEPPADYKCKDKFLIQSAVIVSEFEDASLPELWSNLEKESKANIHEQKIRCAILAAEENDAAQDHAGDQSAMTEGTPSKYTSAMAGQHDDQSPTPPSYQTDGASETDQPKPISQIASDARSQPAGETAHQAKDSISASTAAAGAAVAGAAGAAGAGAMAAKDKVTGGSQQQQQQEAPQQSDSTSEDLQKKLNEAKAEIEKLKAQLKESSNGAASRPGQGQQRSVAFQDEPSAALSQSIKEAQVDGVAFNHVIMISIAVFIFTWMFF